MKTLIVIVLLLVAGCIPTTQQVNTLTNNVDELMVAVDNYQEKFAGEVDKVQERIVLVNEAVKKKADEGLVEQLVEANEASRPFNPYADEVNAILGLVTVIGGIWAKGEYDKKKQAETSLEEVVIGVEDFKKNGGNLKLAFNAVESLVTRRKVAKILSNT